MLTEQELMHVCTNDRPMRMEKCSFNKKIKGLYDEYHPFSCVHYYYVAADSEINGNPRCSSDNESFYVNIFYDKNGDIINKEDLNHEFFKTEFQPGYSFIKDELHPICKERESSNFIIGTLYRYYITEEQYEKEYDTKDGFDYTYRNARGHKIPSNRINRSRIEDSLRTQEYLDYCNDNNIEPKWVNVTRPVDKEELKPYIGTLIILIIISIFATIFINGGWSAWIVTGIQAAVLDVKYRKLKNGGK